MEQKDELMGIPQLIHFNAMLITGALFLAIVLMKYLGQSNSMFVVSFILLLSLGLLITSADFFIEGHWLDDRFDRDIPPRNPRIR